MRTLDVLAPVYGGATWRLKAELAPDTIRSSLVEALDEVTAEQVGATRADALKPDKLMLLSLHEDHGRFAIACRELDCVRALWADGADGNLARRCCCAPGS